jgi:aspartate-semialdehyde dehydrogenase
MGYKVAVVGATGNVGREMLNILAEREFPADEVFAIASRRSLGTEVSFGDKTLKCKDLETFDFSQCDFAVMSAGSAVSKDWSPRIGKTGCLVIDNSSCWRYDAEVPLVVPEVNAHTMAKRPARGIIANPNCSTIQMVVALKPLHDAAGLEQVVVSTYQAISGKGARALDEFEKQVRQDINGETPTNSVLPGVLAFNVLADWKHEPTGFSEEESKVVAETRKIMELPNLHVCPTTVRVPVRNGHSESVYARFSRPVTREEAIALLQKAPGVQVMDAIGPAQHPQPRQVSGQDDVFVGRVRQDPHDPRGLFLFVVGDNIRKGAALNAVQVAERAFAQD